VKIFIKFSIILIAAIQIVVAKADVSIPDYPGTLAAATPWADGDSFPVNLTRDGKKEEIYARLYFVDCPETSSQNDNDATRLRSQARYFGVEEASDVLAIGKAATTRTRELLAEPFTVHTKFSNAMGRSRKKRFYVMITLHDKRDLAAVLVQEGLARAFGTSHRRPDGVEGREYKSLLADMELGAAMRKQGVWAKSDVDKLVKMRAQVRREQFELSKFVRGGSFSAITKENPVDINNATRDELKLLHGIGEGLSHQIVINRPYKTIDDLKRVKGLGATTVNRLRPYLIIKAVVNKAE
jgi:competence protein ComEA|tara:strand:- start:924 stop:1814 length:891 start_codon:yes stop_codon:yes gene_type:complete